MNAPRYVVPRALRDRIEQAIACGDAEQVIAERLETDVFTVRRVRSGMDEAARPGSGTRCDPFEQARQKELNRQVYRRQRDRRQREPSR